MKTLLLLVIAIAVGVVSVVAPGQQTQLAMLPADAVAPPVTRPADGAASAARFAAVHVYVDSGDVPLAAYQVEVTATAGDVTLVGLEGGDHAAFRPAPYYDPQALLNNRVVVAAFSTGADLPRGRARVATLMVRVAGPVEPAYAAKVHVAGAADGSPIRATVAAEPVAPDAPRPPPPVTAPATSVSEGAAR